MKSFKQLFVRDFIYEASADGVISREISLIEILSDKEYNVIRFHCDVAEDTSFNRHNPPIPAKIDFLRISEYFNVKTDNNLDKDVAVYQGKVFSTSSTIAEGAYHKLQQEALEKEEKILQQQLSEVREKLKKL